MATRETTTYDYELRDKYMRKEANVALDPRSDLPYTHNFSLPALDSGLLAFTHQVAATDDQANTAHNGHPMPRKFFFATTGCLQLPRSSGLYTGRRDADRRALYIKKEAQNPAPDRLAAAARLVVLPESIAVAITVFVGMPPALATRRRGRKPDSVGSPRFPPALCRAGFNCEETRTTIPTMLYTAFPFTSSSSHGATKAILSQAKLMHLTVGYSENQGEYRRLSDVTCFAKVTHSNPYDPNTPTHDLRTTQGICRRAGRR